MILMYHKVDIFTPSPWWVTPEDLERHLSTLANRRLVYLDDYDDPDRQAVLTFDDGYENIARHALPTLHAADAPFEVFVVGDAIGGWNEFDPGEPSTRLMDITQLEECVRAGGRLQWHTRTHRNLVGLDDGAQAFEMSVPDDLRERFPAPHFTWFAYPEGGHDERAARHAESLFQGAVSVIGGRPGSRWEQNRVVADRNLQLPRLSGAERDALIAGIAAVGE